MLQKRVGLPMLVVAVVVLLVLTVSRFVPGVARAATVGDVTLAVPLQLPITITGIAPGDKESTELLRVRYDGTEPAWIGLDTDMIGPLTEGDMPLTLSVIAANQRLSPRAENQVVGLHRPGDLVNLAIEYALPRASPNAYQGQVASLFIRFHAVQAAENTRFDTNGRPLGPISWAPGLGIASVAARETGGLSPSEVSPCVGEGCAPTLEQQPTGITEGPPAQAGEVTPIVLAGDCCRCTQSLLWIGLLYALLLVLAMLSSFALGWHLHCRRCRKRYRAVSRSRRDRPDDHA